MAPKQYKSRIHLLAAKQAPVIVILQRRRSKLFHVVKVDAATGRVEEGSWFAGKLYPLRCDVSFDGRYMVYMALGARGQPWTGVCELPWLRTLVEGSTLGTWYGGGYFAGPKSLRTNGWRDIKFNAAKSTLPFICHPYASQHGGEDLGVIYERFARDGFVRAGDNWGKDRKLPTYFFRLERIGDDGWHRKFSPAHPGLSVRFAGYFEHGYTFAFTLEGASELLQDATWATWDATGKLWVARPGLVQAYTLRDLTRSAPSITIDVDAFEPPAKPERAPRPWTPL